MLFAPLLTELSRLIDTTGYCRHSVFSPSVRRRSSVTARVAIVRWQLVDFRMLRNRGIRMRKSGIASGITVLFVKR